MLYAREPIFPSEVQARMQEPLAILADSKAETDGAVRAVLERSEWLKRALPIVANNLAIAQHRDTLRYAHTRSGTYLPRLVQFMPGEFVYVRRNDVAALQVKAK
jgi:hypothetical protein